MRRIFISYRRGDSADVTGRIYDKLAAHFGAEQLFKDVDNVPLGTDFKSHLSEQIRECEVCVVIVGPGWLRAGDGDARRLDDPEDFVRIEVAEALARDIPVVPLLVRNAEMPEPDELPNGLREFAYRNGTVVRPDPDFHGDMARVIEGLDAILPRDGVESATRQARPPKRPGTIRPIYVASGVLAVGLLALLAFWGDSDESLPLDIVWTIPIEDGEWLRSHKVLIQGTFNSAVKDVAVTANGNNLEIVGGQFQGTVEATSDGKLPIVLQASGDAAESVRIVRTVRVDANAPTLELDVPDDLLGVGRSAMESDIVEPSEKEHLVTGTVDEYPVSVLCSRPEVSIVIHPSTGPTGPTCGFTATVKLKEGETMEVQFWAVDDSRLESRRVAYTFEDHRSRARNRPSRPPSDFSDFRGFADMYLNPNSSSPDSTLRNRLRAGVSFGSGLSIKLVDVTVGVESYAITITTTAPSSSYGKVLNATQSDIVTFLMSKAEHSEELMKILDAELRAPKYIKVSLRR